MPLAKNIFRNYMNQQRVIALIPARYAASRLPGKLMKVLAGKTVIARTYEAVKATQLFDEVIVVCDHDEIENEIRSIGGKFFRSQFEHESGTDRIAEAAEILDTDIIVNVQGDEPFMNHEALEKVVALFKNPEVQIASLLLPIHDVERINNPNCVKVVVDKQFRALYFSRSPIPYYRDTTMTQIAYQHIGVYAFRKDTLLRFTKMPVSELEKIEKLENLRMLENGIPIHMAVVNHVGISIDTQEDFERAEVILKSGD
jgi:3-deoxy-D-manno-octulosonate cytidylyltransferase